jgi:hypothetical protein
MIVTVFSTSDVQLLSRVGCSMFRSVENINDWEYRLIISIETNSSSAARFIARQATT